MSEKSCAFRITGNLPVFLLAALCGVIESYLVLEFVRGNGLPAVVGHVVVVASLAAYLRHIQKAGGDLRGPLLLLSFTLGLGPLGCLGAVLTMGMTAIFARTAKPFDEWYASLFPEAEKSDRDFFEKLRLQSLDEPGAVMPLIDLLAFGSHANKQALLTMVASNFRPALTPVLKAALKDANNAIRVQAATTISRLESDFTNQTLALGRDGEKSPDDPELLLRTARHFDDYAYTGLLDSDRERECREQAQHHYRRYLQLVPGDSNAHAAVGRFLVRAKRYEEALQWFEREGETAESHASIWYLECLFETRRFDQLRELAARQVEGAGQDGTSALEISEALKVWARPETLKGCA